MKKLSIIFLALALSLWFSSCSNEPAKKEDTLQPAKGGRYYGGVFRLNEPEYVKNLFPHSIIDVYSYRVASQIYEGLFKFDQKDLKIVKAIIDSYSVDPSNTVYTFRLKDNVYFHDDECFADGKGRKVTAEDIKYCFTLACTQSSNNQSFNLFKDIIKGATEYFNTTTDGNKPSGEIEGLRVLDPLTIQIALTKPTSTFLYNLARPGAFIFPKEAYQKYGVEMRIKCVGTGPFKLSSVDDDISIILKKNENYYGVDEYGNKLPFIDALSIKFLQDKKVELLEFRKGNLDMMYRLPTDYIIEILAEASSEGAGAKQYELQREPELSTQWLVFNTQSKLFGNANLRKAVSFAIDREKILDYVLNGEGYMEGHHGITPPAFKDSYDIKMIKGYKYDLDSAKLYLKKAGYSSGEAVPKITLTLNTEGEKYTNVALEIQKQLKDNLNITLEIEILPFAQIAEKSTTGDFNLIRVAWVADYPNPENYLWAFYGKNVPKLASEKSYPNIARYVNPAFDELYEKALSATSEEEAFAHFMKAEKLLMKDAPVLVMWYDEGYRLMQSYVKNFPSNAMQYRDFSTVYLAPREEKNAANDK